MSDSHSSEPSRTFPCIDWRGVLGELFDKDRIYVIESPHDSSSGVFSDTPNSPEHHSAESGDSTNPAEHGRTSSYNSPSDDIYPPPPLYTSGTHIASKSDYWSCETPANDRYASIPGQTIAENCTTYNESAVSVDDGYECGRYNVRLSELTVTRGSENNVGERHHTLGDGRNVGDVSTTQRTQNPCISSQPQSITGHCETPIESNYASATLGVSPCQNRVADKCRTERCQESRMKTAYSPLSCRSSDYGSRSTVSQDGSDMHDASKTMTINCVTQQHHTGVDRPRVLAHGAEYSDRIATQCGAPYHPVLAHRGLSIAAIGDAAQRRTADGASRCVELPESNEETYAMRVARVTNSRSKEETYAMRCGGVTNSRSNEETYAMRCVGVTNSRSDEETYAMRCGGATNSRSNEETYAMLGGRVTNSRSNDETYAMRCDRVTNSRSSRNDACRRRVPRHRSPSTSSSCDSSDSSAMGCVTRHPSSGWSRDGGVVVTRPKRVNLTRKARSAQLSREGDTYQRIYIKQRPQPPPRTSRWRQQCTSLRETATVGNHSATPGDQPLHGDKPLFSRLPDSALSCVFSHLNSDVLCRCARVCRRWWRLAWSPTLWRYIRIEGATDATINVDKALKALTRRLSVDTPTVCVMIESICLTGDVHLTDKGLYTIARRCPELRCLDINGCADVTNIALFEVVSRCVNLEQLNVAGCENITCVCLTPEATLQASAYGKQVYLQRLDMSDCLGLDDSGLQLIASFCCQLTHLYVRRCGRVGDLGVQFVANYCQGLRELSISDCPAVTDFGARDLGKLEDSLRYLSVAKCVGITDAGITAIAVRCRKLRYLNVRGCDGITDVTLQQLARTNTGLKSLDVGKSDATDDGLRSLAQKCRHLRKLSLKSCARITDAGIASLAQHCRQLRQLNLQDCQLSVDAYRTIKASCRHCIIEHTNPSFF